MAQTFDLTLNKLQRCIETIKSSLLTEQVYNVFEFQCSGSELVSVDNTVSFAELQNKNLEQYAEAKKRTDEYLSLYDDLCKLESGLFNGNTNSGMSFVLSQIKYLKELKTKLMSLKSQIKIYASYTTCTKDNITDKLNLLAQNTLVTKLAPQWNGSFAPTRVYMFTYDDNEYDTKIVQVTKQISDLENKRDKLNATFTVPVELSLKAQKLLGM